MVNIVSFNHVVVCMLSLTFLLLSGGENGCGKGETIKVTMAEEQN